MKYRLFFHSYDLTSDNDPGLDHHRDFYAKNDEAAQKKIKGMVQYSLDVEMGGFTPLRFFRIVKGKTKYQEEQLIEIPLSPEPLGETEIDLR
ncbi:MAG: hypothetical protein UR46_C0024G0006 [Parcubacteria group bacterium GW2011_GWA1_33_6]|uniref:Uncharacterized protein n=1 Tax=Candidatus Staskawiczbacteria bacterium RIFCSPHIGHO2_02_FULL_33_16 TaxID=1802204 RepID=A0A1G2HYM6_9BACT|nr:MAG: hypothetical protein UR46_C0024G0006 [Parcubacteria group bacterium GW2011_GWA1_33_6]OGZ67652.1 MAG: hypothetical protein A3D34_01905 [Candidatus Staskawiczbacteria bacterium RIFCSPHIGHO2_02_FULL_33_16]OGZ70424.1 MAG: hypothetical protein A2980_00675 [Candidatus Staskawiczbacteria bacterium RIFCSPLOWO2_01_FULL_33_13]